MIFHPKNNRWRFAKNFSSFLGLIMIWRGLWYVLDGIDIWLFGGSHAWSAVVGVLLGIVLIYWPDKNLKEIERL